MIDKYIYENDFTLINLGWFKWVLVDNQLGKATYHKSKLTAYLKARKLNKPAF